MSRDVEYQEDINGNKIMLSKCATCFKDPKTCGTKDDEFIKEKEFSNGNPLSHKIVWCKHHDRVR